AHAKLENSPSVYSIDKDIFNSLSTSPAKYRDRLVDSLPVDAFINGIKIIDLTAPDTPLVSAARTAHDAIWTPPQTAPKMPPEENVHMNALAAQLVKVRAREYSEKSFSLDYKHNHLGTEIPEGWRYRLEYTFLRPPSATASAVEKTHTLFLSPRLGGTTQIVGSPTRDCIFHAEQALIDALFPLTFGKTLLRDLPNIPTPPELPPNPIPPPSAAAPAAVPATPPTVSTTPPAAPTTPPAAPTTPPLAAPASLPQRNK
ncbi:MAG: hypothetical protein LBS59_00470, partial [Puniceicoccales bacterium]|nr:hypothetical protein [Puniceicoccales bacterium]